MDHNTFSLRLFCTCLERIIIEKLYSGLWSWTNNFKKHKKMITIKLFCIFTASLFVVSRYFWAFPSEKIDVFSFQCWKRFTLRHVSPYFSALKTSMLKTFQCFDVFFSAENINFLLGLSHSCLKHFPHKKTPKNNTNLSLTSTYNM